MIPEKQHAALLEEPVLRSLTKLAAPIVIANMLQAGYQLVDAFWVGRLGGNEHQLKVPTEKFNYPTS